MGEKERAWRAATGVENPPGLLQPLPPLMKEPYPAAPPAQSAAQPQLVLKFKAAPMLPAGWHRPLGIGMMGTSVATGTVVAGTFKPAGLPQAAIPLTPARKPPAGPVEGKIAENIKQDGPGLPTIAETTADEEQEGDTALASAAKPEHEPAAEPGTMALVQQNRRARRQDKLASSIAIFKAAGVLAEAMAAYNSSDEEGSQIHDDLAPANMADDKITAAAEIRVKEEIEAEAIKDEEFDAPKKKLRATKKAKKKRARTSSSTSPVRAKKAKKKKRVPSSSSTSSRHKKR